MQDIRVAGNDDDDVEEEEIVVDVVAGAVGVECRKSPLRGEALVVAAMAGGGGGEGVSAKRTRARRQD